MRNILVSHLGQMPFVAGLPFLSFTFCGLFISRFALHLTQYPVTIVNYLLTVKQQLLNCCFSFFISVGKGNLPGITLLYSPHGHEGHSY